MLSEEALYQLTDRCAGIIDDNWEGSVSVSQDENGCILLELHDEDGASTSRLQLSPYGQAMNGEELWKYTLNGEQTDIVSTLAPRLLLGALGL